MTQSENTQRKPHYLTWETTTDRYTTYSAKKRYLDPIANAFIRHKANKRFGEGNWSVTDVKWNEEPRKLPTIQGESWELSGSCLVWAECDEQCD
jgi:hypothetical protein